MHPYIIGFIAADGHISKSNRLMISQNEDGHDLLVEINRILGKGKIKEQKMGFSHYGKKKMLSFETQINDSDISNLESWGIPKGPKTYSLSFPDSKSDNEIWLYLRGFFDGDGSISIEKKGYARVQIISNDNWCNKCSEFLNSQGISSFVSKDNRHKSISNVHIRRNNHIHDFMDRIYQDSTGLKLKWKYEKWIRISEMSPRLKNFRKFKKECFDLIMPLLKSGKKYDEIASQVGCSKNLVNKIKIENFGSLRTVHSKRRVEVENLFNSGKSRTDIVKLGYGNKLVRRVFETKFGDSKEFRKMIVENKRREVEKMLRLGFEYKEIAKKVHTDFGTISKIKKKIKGEIS